MSFLRYMFTVLVALSLCACATTQFAKPVHRHSVEEDNELAESLGYVPEDDHSGDNVEAIPKFIPTQKGLFKVKLTPNNSKFVVGENSAVVQVTDADGRPLTGATLEVIPWMVLHGHGISARPESTEGEGGSYTVNGIALPMAGLWELRFIVINGETSDTFSYGPFSTVQEATATVEYIKLKSPAGYNVTLGVASKPNVLEPEVLVDEKGRTVKHFKLTVEEISFDLYPGKTVLAWGFNGTVPGPEMRVTEGDIVRVTLTNNVRDSHHTVHIHGLRKDMASDGVPFLSQTPTEFGASYTYEFIATPSGTSWYHCHVDSAHHVDMGMYGPFIVEPKVPEVEFDREYVWVLDEWPSSQEHMHKDTGSAPDDHAVVTRHPGVTPQAAPGKAAPKRDWYPETYKPYNPIYDSFLINGRSYPYTTPLEVLTGERVKIRVINVGYTSHFMHIHSHKFLVTHRDGRKLANPIELDTVEVGPGQRADLILVADNPGVWPFHCHRLNHIANDNIYPGGMLTFLRYMDWAPPGETPPAEQENFFDDLE